MNLLEELVDALPLTKAGAFFPSRPSGRTVWRWAAVGLCGVKLEAWKSGGKTVTTRAAAHRFLERINAANSLGRSAEPAVPDVAARGREAATALEKLGA